MLPFTHSKELLPILYSQDGEKLPYAFVPFVKYDVREDGLLEWMNPIWEELGNVQEVGLHNQITVPSETEIVDGIKSTDLDTFQWNGRTGGWLNVRS